MPVPRLFVRVAKKQLDKTSRSKANKERAIEDMFQHFLYHADMVRMSKKFQNWLARKVTIERASLWSDHRFVALLVDDEIQHFWSAREFKNMWTDSARPSDEVSHRKLHGAYVIHGSVLAEVLADTPNRGSFEVRIKA